MDAEGESQLLDPDRVLHALDILWRECQEKKAHPLCIAILMVFPLVSKKFKRHPLMDNAYSLLLLLAYSHVYEDTWYNPERANSSFGDYIVGMKVTGPVVMEFLYWNTSSSPISYLITESFELEYPYALNYFNFFNLRCKQGQENIKAIKWRFIHADHRSDFGKEMIKTAQNKRNVLYHLPASPLILRD